MDLRTTRNLGALLFLVSAISGCMGLGIDVDKSEDPDTVEHVEKLQRNLQGGSANYIINGGFEDGTLSPWMTDSTYPSTVDGGCCSGYYVREGSYGLRLPRYIGSTYFPSWVKQELNLDGCYVPVELSFWMRSVDRQVKVTVEFADGATSSWIFGTSWNWVKRSIQSGFNNVGLRSIKIERMGSPSGNTTAIDSIDFQFNNDGCTTCPNDPEDDADDDGLCGDVDPCPYDPENDADGDGVCGDVDRCPGTLLPESVPTQRLGINRFADVDGDGQFDTSSPNGVGPQRSYTMADTAGCSCEQIIDEFELGNGHRKFGCSISAMDDWVAHIEAGGYLQAGTHEAMAGCTIGKSAPSGALWVLAVGLLFVLRRRMRMT